MKFLTFFSSLVGSIGLIFHIVKVLNSLHDLALVSIMFQMINYAYISIIYLKWGFQPCSRVGTSDWLDIAYFEITKWNSQFSHSGFLLILQIMIVQNVFQHLTLVPVGFSAIFCRMRHSKPILLITIVQNVYKISHWSQSFETLLIISNKHNLHISWHLLELMLQIMIPYYTKLRRGPFKRRLIKDRFD